MSSGVARVEAALRSAGLAVTVEQLATSTRTAGEAAEALGVTVAQIAKTLVFVADGEPVVAVVRGVDRVDTSRLASALGAALVRRADADEVRAATGFPIGGVSPAGLAPELRVVVDDGLGGAGDELWAAAGTPFAVYRTTFADLVAVSGGRVSSVAAPTAD